MDLNVSGDTGYVNIIVMDMWRMVFMCIHRDMC